jgi:hypothetical protein
MARVVRPGGWVATYNWDIPGAGTPVHPIYTAMESLGMPAPRPPGAAVSHHDSMRALWEDAGLESIESRVIRIPVVYSDFDDFWDANSVPAGASGKTIHDMSPTVRQQIRARVREQLLVGADGRIAYEAIANAVKGRVGRRR